MYQFLKDFSGPIATILASCTAVSVTWYFGSCQRQIAQDKLRLDLYNRRFDVYEKMLLFYQSLMSYGGSDETFTSRQRDFIKAMKESQFLFDESSGIHQELSKIHVESFKVIGYHQHGKQVASQDPEVFLKMATDSQNMQANFAGQIEAIEKAMAPYLNFHRLAA